MSPATLVKSKPCPECGKVFEGTARYVPAMLASHRRSMHGVKGTFYEKHKSSTRFQQVAEKPQPTAPPAPPAPPVTGKGAWSKRQLMMDPESVARRAYQSKLRAEHRAMRLAAKAQAATPAPMAVVPAGASGEPMVYLKGPRKGQPITKAVLDARIASRIAYQQSHSANGVGGPRKVVPAAAPAADPFPICFCPRCGKDLRATIAASTIQSV